MSAGELVFLKYNIFYFASKFLFVATKRGSNLRWLYDPSKMSVFCSAVWREAGVVKFKRSPNSIINVSTAVSARNATPEFVDGYLSRSRVSLGPWFPIWLRSTVLGGSRVSAAVVVDRVYETLYRPVWPERFPFVVCFGSEMFPSGKVSQTRKFPLNAFRYRTTKVLDIKQRGGLNDRRRLIGYVRVYIGR